MRALLTLATIAALASAAAAQPHVREARQLVADGLAAQEAGRYREAIARYQQAYQRVPHPEILFNLGQAHRLAGDEPAALAYYRRYLAADPDGRAVDDARRWVAELETALAARARDRALADAPPPARPSARGRRLRVAGLATGALGGLALGLGGTLALDARAIERDLGGHDGPWTDALLARQHEGELAARRARLVAGAGGALVAAGLALYLVGRRERAIVVAPQPTGVAVVGRF